MKYKAKDYLSFTSHAAFGSSLTSWLKMLAQNRLYIHPFFIPKALFITGAIVLSVPFQWYERIKFRKKLQSVKIKRPVFILGHPRSGTTFLHYLMSKDPSFSYCTTTQALIPHLFLTWSGVFSGLLSKALPEKRPMDNLKMGSDLPKEEEFALAGYGPESMVTGYYFPKYFNENFENNVLFLNNLSGKKKWQKHFDHFLRKISYAAGGKTLLMKSPANTARVSEILALYPDAKFIHIYRNPYDVFQSHLHLFKKLLPMLSFHHVNEKQLEEIVFATYISIHEKYFKDKNLIPFGQLVEVRYENFIADPLRNLEEIYSSLNLSGYESAKDYFENELQSYKDYSRNEFKLSRELAIKISERFEFAFRELGYDLKYAGS